MTIASNQPIYYSDLRDTVLSNILAMVKNKDSYDVSVPEQIKNGYTYREEGSANRTNVGGTDGQHGSWSRESNCFINYSLNDPNLGVVTTQRITSDFDSFLISRGINTKSDKAITTKGILNFFNNVAAFCSVRLVIVSSLLLDPSTRSNNRLFYYPGTVVYPIVPVTDDYGASYISSSNITDLLNNLQDTLGKVSKTYTANYSISATSCCSSSSSSSSSSSAYIAYFNID